MPKLRAVAIALVALLASAAGLVQSAWADEGYATWYGQPYHGRTMANGQVFDMYDPTTTASNEFPFGTWLRVTNPKNGHVVEVQVRDRGGFSHALDLSYAAFAKLAPPEEMMIRIQYEVIPGPGQPPATPPPPAASEPAPEPAPAPAPPSEPATVASGPQPTPASYTVQVGDTLRAISGRFGLNALDVAAWNELADPNLLKPGQTLRLIPPPPPAPAQPPGEIYVVEEGDVLWKIAERFEVDPGALVRANNLGPDDLLHIGQELVIPSSAVYHAVEAGETLASIAERYDTTTQALLALNELADPDLLSIGQRLRVR